MTDERSKVWFRMHKNGLIASVSESPLGPDRYICGATRPHEAKSFGEVRGFSEAKVEADRDSGCRQPCDCPPWAE